MYKYEIQYRIIGKDYFTHQIESEFDVVLIEAPSMSGAIKLFLHAYIDSEGLELGFINLVRKNIRKW